MYNCLSITIATHLVEECSGRGERRDEDSSVSSEVRVHVTQRAEERTFRHAPAPALAHSNARLCSALCTCTFRSYSMSQALCDHSRINRSHFTTFKIVTLSQQYNKLMSVVCVFRRLWIWTYEKLKLKTRGWEAAIFTIGSAESQRAL